MTFTKVQTESLEDFNFNITGNIKEVTLFTLENSINYTDYMDMKVKSGVKPNKAKEMFYKAQNEFMADTIADFVKQELIKVFSSDNNTITH